MKQASLTQIRNDKNLFRALVEDLKNGQIAAMPTDTLFGLAADSQNVSGTSKIFDVKGREETKPLILFISHPDQLADLGITPLPELLPLLKRHWPGAFTAIFSLPTTHPLTAFSHPTIGIRIPAHEELLQFLREYPGFLLTTSANVSGQAPLNTPDIISAGFGEALDWLITADQQPSGNPSTVVDFSCNPPQVLRQGAVRMGFPLL